MAGEEGRWRWELCEWAVGGGGGGELEEGVDEVLDTVSGGVFEVFFEVSAGWVESVE